MIIFTPFYSIVFEEGVQIQAKYGIYLVVISYCTIPKRIIFRVLHLQPSERFVCNLISTF